MPIGLGQIYYGPTLWLNYNIGGLSAGEDPRTPDIIVTPNVGMTYSGSTAMIGDHGGFAHDDTNVMMLLANPAFKAAVVSATTTTTQIAPTIVKALGLDPLALDAVREEGTAVLPDVVFQMSGWWRRERRFLQSGADIRGLWISTSPEPLVGSPLSVIDGFFARCAVSRDSNVQLKGFPQFHRRTGRSAPGAYFFHYNFRLADREMMQ